MLQEEDVDCWVSARQIPMLWIDVQHRNDPKCCYLTTCERDSSLSRFTFPPLIKLISADEKFWFQVLKKFKCSDLVQPVRESSLWSFWSQDAIKNSSYVADFPPDPKLLRLRLRPEPAGHHAVVQRSGQQPAAARHRQDLPERERIRRVREVRPHLQHAHPLPHLPLHRHAHHRLRSALRHHRHPQVGMFKM